MNTVKGLKVTESMFLMEKIFKYKFSLVTFNPDTSELQSKNWGVRKYYLENYFLDEYDLNYSISDRERIGKVWYMGRSKRKPVIETQRIDWRWTIYNLKVIRIKSAKYWFKITFKVRLTPKEAFILGESLKKMHSDVSYKKVLKKASSEE